VVRGKLGRKRVREHRPSAIDREAFATGENDVGVIAVGSGRRKRRSRRLGFGLGLELGSLDMK
jgi:hypothetical protein